MEFVVNGEASETDDESSNIISLRKSNILAIEVAGEETETESEEEELYDGRMVGACDSLHQRPTSSASHLGNNNLLQRKLITTNANIWKNTKNFPKNYVTSASKTILSCDQLLVRSMQILQTVSQSLNATNKKTQQLRDRVKNLNYVPEIRMPN